MPTKKCLFNVIAVALASLTLTAHQALAQGGFNPFWQDQFGDRKKARPAPAEDGSKAEPLPPMSDPPSWGTPRRAPAAGAPSNAPGNASPNAGQPWPPSGVPAPVDIESLGVESNDLSPVMAGDGTGLPYELWRGLTTDEIGELIASLTIPPKSAALHQLWQRLITSNVPPPGANADTTRFAALRAEALYRSGLLKDSGDVLDSITATGADPLIDMLKARTAIATGDKSGGCAKAKGLVRSIKEIPKALAVDASLTIGYCATLDNNRAAAGLSADLASENGVSQSPGLDALKAFSLGTKPKLKAGASYGLVDYLALKQAGVSIGPDALVNATPALLAYVANDAGADPDLRLAAAEAAVTVNAISVEDLADLYRSSTPSDATPAVGRAGLYQQAERETMPLRKARHVRAFLDDARQAGFYWHALKLMAPVGNEMALVPEIGWFAETGIETSLAAGDIDNARKWAAFAASQHRTGANHVGHWTALIDLAATNAGRERMARSLTIIEDLAVRGRLDPGLLHRLATVLDALDVQVPIPLWEAASRTPQPTTGHLPETGILSRMQRAAKKKEFGRTVLLVMKTLGPDGTEGAHMIALGDSIRALKRAGLESDARKLGLEALFATWPRALTN